MEAHQEVDKRKTETMKEGKERTTQNREKQRGDREKNIGCLSDFLSEGSALNRRSLQSFPVLARTGPRRGEEVKL